MSLVTIIIPAYNMADGAVWAAESVLAQDVGAKVIIVDDCSPTPITLPDHLLKSPDVFLIRHEHNQGAATARNTGVNAAKTDVIGFLDADDMFLPGTLSARLQHFHDLDSGQKLITGCGWNFGDDPILCVPNEADSTEQFASGCWYCPGSCILGRRELFEALPFANGYERLEDLDWGLRFGMAGGQLSVLPLAGARIEPGYNSSFDKVKRSADLLLDNFADTEPLIFRNLRAYLHLEKAASARNEGKWLALADNMIRSLVLKPRTRLHFSPFYRRIKQSGD